MTGRTLTPGGSNGRDIVASATSLPSANGGLVWTRYLPVWRGDERRPYLKGGARDEKGSETKAALDGFVKRHKESEKAALPLLKERVERRERALKLLAQRSGRVVRIVTVNAASRFASGLGAEHPTENGFTFDPASGLPIVPGSSVKGLCRRAARFMGKNEEAITRWFGPERITAATTDGQGAVSFYDGLPKYWPRLSVEIVNCHHFDYYRKAHKARGEAIPTETESPVPAFFLTVDKGAKFDFAFLAPSEADANMIHELLVTGLAWLGVGAKTAAGYGLMDVE